MQMNVGLNEKIHTSQHNLTGTCVLYILVPLGSVRLASGLIILAGYLCKRWAFTACFRTFTSILFDIESVDNGLLSLCYISTRMKEILKHDSN